MTNPNLTMEQKIDVIFNIVTSLNFLDILNILGVGLGFYNSYLNQKQIDNNTIVDELHKQNNEYLDKTIEKLDELLKLLGEKNAQNRAYKTD